MTSWRGAIDIPAPEVHRLTAVLPLVLDRLRGLPVRAGVVLDPWRGDEPLDLRVVAGTHPAVGTTYEGTLHATDRPWSATVEADDARAVRAVVVDDVGSDDEVRLVVEVPMPAHPTEIRLEHLMSISDDGFMAGSVESEATLSWEMLAVANGGVHRLVTVSLGHPRFRAGVVADVAPSGDEWRVTADAFVTGRGIVRPLFALMMVFVGRKMRRVVDRQFADLVEQVEDWNDVVADHPRDDDLADFLVDRWLDQFRPARGT